PDCRNCRLRSRQRRGLAVADDQEIAARHALDRAEEILTEELAVHDRQPPVTPALELLAELPAVAEEAQVPADADGLLLDHRQAVIAGGGGASKHALPDAVDNRFLKRVAVKSEQKKADAGAAVRRLVGTESTFDAGFGVTADDRGRIAGGRLAGGQGPRGCL